MRRGKNSEEAKEFGKKSESLATQEYVRRGYAILERNWRLGKIEIDIIAQKEDVVAIVEVKARRTTEEDALSAVGYDKRKRMIRAADYYLRSLPGNCQYRFDIVACTGTLENIQIEIYEDAFLAADIF